MRPALLLIVLLSACGAKTAPEAAAASDKEAYRPVVEKTLPDGLILQEIDLDRDRQADVFNYYVEREVSKDRDLVRKELDGNRDGRVDSITYFNDEALIEREEMDADFDGRFDWIDHYQNSQRVMSEVDSDHDGKMDVFAYYEGNPARITRKERDTNADGNIDFWERFSENGMVTKTGRDTDNDGKMDVRDE